MANAPTSHNGSSRRRLRALLPSVHIFGWRQVNVILPRLWRWSTCWRLRLLPGWLDVGLRFYRDDEGEMVGALALAPLLIVNVEFARMFTRREQRARRAAIADDLADEATSYLGAHS